MYSSDGKLKCNLELNVLFLKTFENSFKHNLFHTQNYLFYYYFFF